jgi:hypothetical protein
MQGHARFHCRLLPLCRIVAAALVLAAASTVAQAQVPSNETWRTIATEHFRVHFTPQLETQARHAASVAERAYANLAGELARPRGLIDVVISDATDASNGSATVVPRPSIIIYARPPVDEPSLESYDDWTVLVMQHELTHIFHLDRSRGWWRAAQSVFGRNPVLFPNYYTPAWLTEGLAVYYESRFTNGGRLHGSFDAVVARSAAIDNVLPPLGDISLATSRFPYGQSVYVYGSFVWDELARSHGASSIPAFVERSSGEPMPFLLDMEARNTFGESFTHAWNRWRDSVLRAVDDSAELRLQPRVAAPGFGSSQAFELSDGGRYILAPRWVNDSTIVYAANTGRSSPGLYIARRGETPERVSRRNSLDMNDPSRPGEIVYAQGDYIDRFHTRGDLYVSTQFGDRRITRGQRLSEPSVRRDGTIIAVRTVPGTTQLVRVSSRGDTIVPLTPVAPDTQWTDPRWSPDGGRIAAVRISAGVSAVVVLDSIGRVLSTPVIERAVIRSPAWLPDGSGLIFTSDVDGTSQLYVAGVDSSDAPSRGLRLTADAAGLYGADVVGVDDDSVRVVTTALRGDGYHVLVWTVAGVQVAPPVTIQSAGVADSISHVSLSQASSSRGSSSGASSVGASAATLAVGRTDPRWRVTDDTTRARAYSPWRTLAPAYWSPTFAQAGAGRGDLIGALTGASDVTGRHSYIAQAAINLHNSNVDASLAYDYDRWINPALAFSLDQSWSYASITSAGVKVGDLERRSRFASVHATFPGRASEPTRQ